ncbi:hypothetical protein GCM10027592_03230 [Spirosoma flavus]
MDSFLTTLKSRNSVLYWFGLFCLIGGVICALLALITNVQVMNINAFIKPGKFFLSTTVFCWTMAWYVVLLRQQRQVKIYSWVVVVTLTIELIIIVGQATLGKLSHFNISSPVDAILFSLMGMLITLFTVWTAYIGSLFFTHKPAEGDIPYVWGIRMGILLFVIFAFEGFMMAAQLRHTVGAPDGGPGLPVVNWSTRYGDLRVAHFFGMHALQLLPLFGYYVARRWGQVVLLAAFYLLFVTFLMMQALSGTPLLAGLVN